MRVCLRGGGVKRRHKSKKKYLGKITQLSMANYPILNSNSSEVSRRKSVRRRARERHTGGLQRPLPHGHTDTQRHTQSHPPSTFHFNTSEIGGKGASSTALPRGTWLRASHLPPRVWVGGAKGPRGVASLCQLVRPWEGAPQAISFLWLGGGPPPPHSPGSSAGGLPFHGSRGTPAVQTNA